MVLYLAGTGQVPWAWLGGKGGTMPASFEELWQQNHQAVYGGLRKCGATHAEADDALGQGSLQAWQAHERFDPARASFRTWLGCISFRCWLKLLSERKRQMRLEEESSDAAVCVEFDEADPDELTLTELAGILTETIQDRERTIASLGQQPTDTYRMIAEELLRGVRAGERVRQSDIARALGIDRSSVCRCFAYLRQELPGLRPQP